MIKASWITLVLVLVAAPAAAAPNATFVHANGVHKIDDTGKVTTVVPDKALAITLTVAADGELWFATVDGKVHKGKPGKVVKLPAKSENQRYAIAMTPAAKGGIWALGREALFRITPKLKLETHKLPIDRMLGEATILEVGDVVWIASDHGVFKFAAGKWETARPDSHDHVVRDSNGTVWTAAHKKDAPDLLVGFDGTKWLEAPIEGEGVAELAAGKDGRIYALVWGKGWRESRIVVLMTTAGSPKWTARKFGGVDGLKHLAVDDTERVWSSLQHGVVVFGKDGKQLVHMPPGSVAGLTGNVREIVIAASGPSQLPSAGAIAKGSVIGRIMKSTTEPLANTTFEICVGNCFDRSPKFKITTDADGKFKADDVAAIEYTSVLDLRTGNNVVHSIGNFTLAGGNPSAAAVRIECCMKLVAGKTLDLGIIRAPTQR